MVQAATKGDTTPTGDTNLADEVDQLHREIEELGTFLTALLVDYTTFVAEAGLQRDPIAQFKTSTGRLTPTGKRILVQMVADGHPQSLIARTLGISTPAVCEHVKRLKWNRTS